MLTLRHAQGDKRIICHAELAEALTKHNRTQRNYFAK